MTFLVAIVLILIVVLAAYAGYSIGVRRATSPGASQLPASSSLAAPAPSPAPSLSTTGAAASALVTAEPRDVIATTTTADELMEADRVATEKARIIRSRDAEAAALRAELASRPPQATDDEPLKERCTRLSGELADAQKESARYRRLVVDIENNAPPPILAGAGEPDDLKLIVGIGPVLERMLHNLGVTTFRQIARWSARDSADFDARLPEFPGRIVRDQWVTQARELHLAKFGEPASERPPRT